MADRINDEVWAQNWSVPVETAAATRAQLHKELFYAFNSPRTTPQTGRIVLFADHLQRPGATGMYLL